MIKNRLVFMQSNRYSSQILIKLEFSQYIFEKYSNIKSFENHASGGRDVPCGETGGHDEANCRFSKFYERAQKLCLTRNITFRM